MPPTFQQVTTPEQVAPGRFAFTVHDGWQQGRGAFGGLALAAMARAVESFAATPERRLRTLTAELCGPVVPGPAEIVVEALRIGQGTSTIAARLLQGGALQTHAVVVLGRDREPATACDPLPCPPMPPWRDVASIPDGVLAPPFARHFEYRPTGFIPFAGGSEPRAAGWVRLRDSGPLRDDAFVVAMADAWWPALFAVLRAPRPMATVTFTVDVVGDCAGLDPDAPLFHDARTLSARVGYAPELRTLWGADGRLLAINHQTFVIIR